MLTLLQGGIELWLGKMLSLRTKILVHWFYGSLPTLPSLEESTAFPEDGSAHPLWQWLRGILLGSIAEEINVRIHCKCCCWQRTNIQNCWSSELTKEQQKVPYSGVEGRGGGGRPEETRDKPLVLPHHELTNQVLYPHGHPLWRPLTGYEDLCPEYMGSDHVPQPHTLQGPMTSLH